MEIDRKLSSWIETELNSDFPIQNIPFGIISTKEKMKCAASRIGNTIIDLSALADAGYFNNSDFNVDELKSAFAQPYLNELISKGRPYCTKLRKEIAVIFSKGNPILSDDESKRDKILISIDRVEMCMPVKVGDYTDFYSSIDHATNVGKMFRDPENALLPNWKHLPVAYHGRSSSIVVSGTNIHRPSGQTKANDENSPSFGPSKLLDFELEMAFITCKESQLSDVISTKEASNYIYGLVLFNDLSARDIQKWEYVPLGPFLSKNFGSVISPWLISLDALESFKTKGPVQNPEVLPYLKFEQDFHYDIQLEVYLQPENDDEYLICKSNYRYLYWNILQQLAHHTITGCNINIGDMCASGTISGPDEGSFGSMLELAWQGTKALKLKNGVERKFINDNDTIIMRAFAQKDGLRIGFGESKTKILPAKKIEI